MAVSTRRLNGTEDGTVRSGRTIHRLVQFLIWGLALAALSTVISAAGGIAQTLIDDIRFGRPRTSQLSAFVGRVEEAAGPTHLLALNLDRQVVLLEIPGGDISRMQTVPGPYLVGAGEALTPVLLFLADETGDQLPDLIVRIKNEELVYVNRGDRFSPMTAAERAASATAER